MVTKVSDLIDRDMNWWKDDLIDEAFDGATAQCIKQIPLSNLSSPDYLQWGETKIGLFTISSAYKVELARMTSRGEGESSIKSKNRSFWHKIWSLNVPGKVRHFVWRVCNETLPTRLNLNHRKILKDLVCLMCKNGVETTTHTL